MGDAPPTSDPPCTSSSVPSTHSGGPVSGDTSGDAPDDGARTVASDAAAAGPGPAGHVSDTAGPKWSRQMHSLDCVIRNRGLIETADVETLWQAAHALLSHAGPSARAGGADAAAGGAPAGARRRVTEKGRVGALEAEVAEKTAQIKELQLRIAALAMRESVLTDLACLTIEAAPAMGGARPPFPAPQQRGGGGSSSSSGTGSGGDGGDGGGGGVAAAEEAAAMADASLASPSVLSGPIREALAAIWADTALQERVERMTTEEYLRRTQDTVMELALHLTHCKDDPEAMARLEATARRHRLEEGATAMLAPNTLIDAQHRRQDTGERAPPPQSHWRRAWARTQPTLDDETERRLLHAGLQFQNAMKALDQERQAILEQHRDISSPEAAQQLEERLQQVLARYQATALTQHLFTIFTPTSAMCWANIWVGSYPYIPPAHSEVFAEMLRGHLLRLADRHAPREPRAPG